MVKIAFGKMIYYRDKTYSFIELFNEKNGTLIRSNVICDGKETDMSPTLRSFPELLDIGIMGCCNAGEKGICKVAGVDCYQNAPVNRRPNMSFNDYKGIIEQCNGRAFQVALGGAGDPNKHERFEDILKVSRDNHIVPNMTTSGYELTDREVVAIKKYCGAVAVSFYSMLDKSGKETNPVTIKAINDLVSAGCVTNIHYVISKSNIHEAIHRVKNGLFPDGVNAVVFLLYKPVGMGKSDNMLSFLDSGYYDFLNAISNSSTSVKYGFDSCQSPAINRVMHDIAMESIEYCDAARFSMYIDSDLVAYPCSFGRAEKEFSVNLRSNTVKQAWNSKQFERFRNKQVQACTACSETSCRNCALGIGINLCGKLRNLDI